MTKTETQANPDGDDEELEVTEQEEEIIEGEINFRILSDAGGLFPHDLMNEHSWKKSVKQVKQPSFRIIS